MQNNRSFCVDLIILNVPVKQKITGPRLDNHAIVPVLVTHLWLIRVKKWQNPYQELRSACFLGNTVKSILFVLCTEQTICSCMVLYYFLIVAVLVTLHLQFRVSVPLIRASNVFRSYIFPCMSWYAHPLQLCFYLADNFSIACFSGEWANRSIQWSVLWQFNME